LAKGSQNAKLFEVETRDRNELYNKQVHLLDAIAFR
jgi:hypothetical protein